MKKIDTILQERGQEYGDFTKCSEVTQLLMDATCYLDYSPYLSSNENKVLFFVLEKMSRILNNPQLCSKSVEEIKATDSFVDIIGYVTLLLNNQTSKILRNKEDFSIPQSNISYFNTIKEVSSNLNEQIAQEFETLLKGVHFVICDRLKGQIPTYSHFQHFLNIQR